MLRQFALTVSQHEVAPVSCPVPQHDARSIAARCGFWFRCTQHRFFVTAIFLGFLDRVDLS